MISICIPIYNYDVRTLVHALQASALVAKYMISPFHYEIILIDDNSNNEFKKCNAEIETLEKVVYITLENNIGRSKIRNLFTSVARFDYLIFLDCDAAIPNTDFIYNYYKTAVENANRDFVIAGGRFSTRHLAQADWRLRWKYGIERESETVEERLQYPNRSFTTFNFMISKAVLAKIRFDESLSGYGHEDTLFGYELSRQGVTVQHIANPAIHLGLESNAVFIKKTENGIKNLLQLYKKLNFSAQLAADIKLLRYYERLQKMGFAPALGRLFPFLKPLLLWNLNSRFPSLFLFDVYKILFFCNTNLNELR